ncbi:hypothetical protein BSZ22_20325 [Bradyrhizobium canariense]|uniref:Transglutaminase-like cysteine proteinase BTLCP n=3 Tax=Bradyrhizobium canariense TaxID=255045 RepID=A0A1X3HE34_9BRAD|nr:hypothetical protein BSZ22_20325 [Bradyrhizobium canariense]OSI79450.1 hypothetical protein BSZ23_14615 [Bradyrhizobium canariense]OSI89681.1 hypothetical protein BSZ25_20790 [Bradyrhizobium canariense]OSI91071.1 hypothetical protein BSZ24_18415 [Bradyrhizobium canariense]OSJ04046.1 hypothetical protein BSZ16_15220 [Bradyrhizobium canariense]
MIRHALRMLATIYCICSQPAYSSYESQAVAPPLSFSLFCIQYPEDCQHHDDRRIRDFRSSIQRWRELAQINSTVNFGIAPKNPLASRRDAEWQILPSEGNCGDYAVTKRHLLLRSGWPSSALRLAEVVIRTTGEHHLVLLVREGRAIFVLDNLRPVVTPLADALEGYIVLRAESGTDPELWTREIAAF